MTNLEKIRSMNEDDLIELLLTFESGNMQYCLSHPPQCDDSCGKCLRVWLESEVE